MLVEPKKAMRTDGGKMNGGLPREVGRMVLAGMDGMGMIAGIMELGEMNM